MSSKDDAFLEEARLGPRTRVLIECEEIPNLSRLGRRFREYVLTDLAHAVMLTETGIVPPERGARLLEGLLDMYDSGGEGFPWLAESGSFLVQTEHHLGQCIGDDIAGRLQTGRSRNDQSAAAERLYVRDLLLDVAAETLLLQHAVLAQAETHAETLMSGYTHLQHAQPTTFGHHMMRCAAAFDRDLERLRDAWPRVNLSSLGGAGDGRDRDRHGRRRLARGARRPRVPHEPCDHGERAPGADSRPPSRTVRAAGGAPSLARGQRGAGGVGDTRLDSPGPGTGPKLSVDREFRRSATCPLPIGVHVACQQRNRLFIN